MSCHPRGMPSKNGEWELMSQLPALQWEDSGVSCSQHVRGSIPSRAEPQMSTALTCPLPYPLPAFDLSWSDFPHFLTWTAGLISLTNSRAAPKASSQGLLGTKPNHDNKLLPGMVELGLKTSVCDSLPQAMPSFWRFLGLSL